MTRLIGMISVAAVMGVFAVLLFAQGRPDSIGIPIWRLYGDGHIGIRIYLNREGRPYTLEGQILNSNDSIVREFKETEVNTLVFSKLFPPFSLSPGTYRLNVTLTDKAKTSTVLDHFPLLTVPDR